MLTYLDTSQIFWIIVSLYMLMMLLGYVMGRREMISIASFSEKKFCDPLTQKIHEQSRSFMMACIKKNQWLLVFLKIFLNNLILVAFVTRILYGVVFLVPLFFTGWVGLGHGLIFSKPKGKAGIILFFEFGGYLFASAVGVSLGLGLLEALLLQKSFVLEIPWHYLLLTALFLLIGALIESVSLYFIHRTFDVTSMDTRDFEDRKREFIKMMEND